MAYRCLKIIQYHKRNFFQRECRYFHVSNIHQKLVQFILSDIGEGIREVTVRDWFVEPGKQVAQFDNICLVESDKASVNITSRYDGVVRKLHYGVGDVALVGHPLIDIDTGSDELETNKIEDKIELEVQRAVSSSDSSDEDSDIYANKALATPSVRRIAKEHNISLNNVKGTGKAGRILKEDMLSYLNLISNSSQTKLITENIRRPQEEKIQPITGVKKVMVNTMTASGLIPTFCYCDEINMNNIIKLKDEVKETARKKEIHLTYMPFFIKALSKCLEEYPELNAVLDEKCENIIFKAGHNIGVAMDSKLGLIVPNLKNVQSLSIIEIAVELTRLLKSGKSGIVSPADLSGGTFTISNIGIIGGTYTRPLILPPELGIVALGKIKETPVFNDKNEVIKGHIMCASWSADHRVIDGATMAKFATAWKNYIEQPSMLILDL